MAKKKPQIVGRWRITSMTEWDQDFVDEEFPGYFEFKKDGLGDYQFGYVRCRHQGSRRIRRHRLDPRLGAAVPIQDLAAGHQTSDLAQDSGGGWRHEVLFEGYPPVEKGTKYPLCAEGERACPPEDCGGPWGLADYVEAIAGSKHEQHDELLEWRGPFDPDAFDAKEATRGMRG